MFDRHPIGYIQTYSIAKQPYFIEVTGIQNGTAIDLYIGETDFLRKGLGWLIELKFINEILSVLFLETECYVYHEKTNIAAIKTSKKAGFVYVKDIFEDGKINEIMKITKQNVVQKIDYLFNLEK